MAAVAARRQRDARHGVALVTVMLLTLLLFVVGIGFLYRQQLQHQAVVQIQGRAIAQGLAEAGLEEARVKLQKDPLFPPPTTPDQTAFVYSEEVKDASGRVVGGFTVAIDAALRDQPTQIIQIRSEGRYAPAGNTLAQVNLTALMDVSPGSGFKIVRVMGGGSF